MRMCLRHALEKIIGASYETQLDVERLKDWSAWEEVALELTKSGNMSLGTLNNFLLRLSARLPTDASLTLPVRSDEERMVELRKEGWARDRGQTWGRNDCMADTLLQLLAFHGVFDAISLPERDEACALSRGHITASDVPPRTSSRGAEPTAFLEHDRHAAMTVAFLCEHFWQIPHSPGSGP